MKFWPIPNTTEMNALELATGLKGPAQLVLIEIKLSSRRKCGLKPHSFFEITV